MIIELPEKELTETKEDYCIHGLCNYWANRKCQCIGFCILDEDDD